MTKTKQKLTPPIRLTTADLRRVVGGSSLGGVGGGGSSVYTQGFEFPALKVA
jgi:hypothetical protein